MTTPGWETYSVTQTGNDASFTLLGTEFIAQLTITVAGNQYKVKYEANGGSGTMADQLMEYGEATALAANTFTHNEGKSFAGWSTSVDGDVDYADGQTVTNLADRGETITLYAKWGTTVNYIDGDGNTHVTEYTEINAGNMPTELSGKYYVSESVTYAEPVTLSGNTTIILKDGVTMSIGTEAAPISGKDSAIDGKGNSLNIYGQSLDAVTAGTLKAYTNCMSPIDLDDGTYIQHSGNVVAKYCDTNNTDCIKANYFTMNGGTLDASTTGYGSNAIACSYDITINGGNVTATATGDRGSRGLLAGSSITINGGSVTATATGDKCLGMRAGSSITLGWTRTTDRIYASSYGLGFGSISFKPGQAFAVNGTIADPSDISGKTLQPCLVLANNDDNTTAINDYNGQTLPNVVLNGRTLCKDGDWNTLCLPFSLTAEQIAASRLAGSTLMTLDTDAASYEHVTGFEDGTLYLNFKTATSIEAGKPYIVKWDSGDNITSPVFTDVTISNATANVSSSYVDFVGNFSSVVLTGGDKSVLYLGSGNTLYYPAANRTINPLRAYFQLKGITAGDLSSGVKMYFGDGDGDEDAIRSIHSSDTKSQNEAWYNLDGRKLNGKPGQKGIYIHNGRKEAVK